MPTAPYSYSPAKRPEDEELLKQGAAQVPVAGTPVPVAVNPATQGPLSPAVPVQPAATVPVPAENADPFARNSTGIEGNPETRFGAAVTAEPTRASIPDAFDSNVRPSLLVPSPALSVAAPGSTLPRAGDTGIAATLPAIPKATVNPPSGGPILDIGTTGAVSPAVAAVPPPTPTPFAGTLPGSAPQSNALPVQPRPLLEDEDDAFRRRMR